VKLKFIQVMKTKLGITARNYTAILAVPLIAEVTVNLSESME
jgi:hypothetical protein